VINFIIIIFNSIAGFFLSVYQETSSWIWPFNLVSGIFHAVAMAFFSLTTAFASLGDWILAVSNQIASFITQATLWQLLAVPIQWAQSAWNWVLNAWNNVVGIIDNWWLVASSQVKDWIGIAGQVFQTLLNALTLSLDSLKAEWTDFTSKILPNLADLVGIAGLIDSTLKVWFPWYDTLVLFITEMGDFFADPLQWIYDKIDEWFERFW